MLGLKEIDNRKRLWMYNDPNFLKNQTPKKQKRFGQHSPYWASDFPAACACQNAMQSNGCCLMHLSSGQGLRCVMNSSVYTALAKWSVLRGTHSLAVESKDFFILYLILGVCVCTYVEAGGLYQCFPWSFSTFSTFYFETVSPTEPGAHQLMDGLASKAWVSFCLCPQCWIIGVHCHTHLLTRVKGDPNSFSPLHSKHSTKCTISPAWKTDSDFSTITS